MSFVDKNIHDDSFFCVRWSHTWQDARMQDTFCTGSFFIHFSITWLAGPGLAGCYAMAHVTMTWVHGRWLPLVREHHIRPGS